MLVKKKLLLHSCCGPCSSGVLKELCERFDVTILFYNPNIYPLDEFEKRAQAQRELMNKCDQLHDVSLIVLPYDPDEFEKKVVGLEDAIEGGARCEKCFELRMERAAVFAKENGYDVFTTTLSVSPYKNAVLLNEIGFRLAKEYSIEYLYADFKKNNGYLKSVENSKKYGIYRQRYCGCRFSLSQ